MARFPANQWATTEYLEAAGYSVEIINGADPLALRDQGDPIVEDKIIPLCNVCFARRLHGNHKSMTCDSCLNKSLNPLRYTKPVEAHDDHPGLPMPLERGVRRPL